MNVLDSPGVTFSFSPMMRLWACSSPSVTVEVPLLTTVKVTGPAGTEEQR